MCCEASDMFLAGEHHDPIANFLKDYSGCSGRVDYRGQVWKHGGQGRGDSPRGELMVALIMEVVRRARLGVCFEGRTSKTCSWNGWL